MINDHDLWISAGTDTEGEKTRAADKKVLLVNAHFVRMQRDASEKLTVNYSNEIMQNLNYTTLANNKKLENTSN